VTTEAANGGTACGALSGTRECSAQSCPTEAPTEYPTAAPTQAPTDKKTEAPSKAPTKAPTAAPIAGYPTANGYTAHPGYEPHGGWISSMSDGSAGTTETPCSNDGCQARPYTTFDSSVCSNLNSAMSPMACQDGLNFWDTNSRCSSTASCQFACATYTSNQFFSETAVQRCAALCDAQDDCQSFLMVSEYNNNCLLSNRGVTPGTAPPDDKRTGWCNKEFQKWWYTKA
jgi:hypothetical protein